MLFFMYSISSTSSAWSSTASGSLQEHQAGAGEAFLSPEIYCLALIEKETLLFTHNMAFFLHHLKKTQEKLQDTTTFYNFAPMKRKIRTYGGYFEAIMETLKEKEQEKV